MNTHDKDEERLAMEAVMESVDPATWPGLTLAQRCALGRFAKPQPAEPVKVPTKWSGWACQYPGKMPRLYGDKSIAMLNHHPEEGDRLLYLVEQSNPIPEQVKVPSDAEIREVLIANGYTIKPGHDDLKPYVYEAARALLAKYDHSLKEN